jgi:cytochrome bd-type quinol oxidase subunit 2
MYPTQATNPVGAVAPGRNKIPQVMGILSIVFGSLVGLFSLFGLLGTGMMMGMGMPTAGEAPGFDQTYENFLELAQVPNLINGVLMVGMSIALIAIGIGQVKYRRWAAQASVIWGAAALVVLVILAIVQFTMVAPAMEQFFNDLAATDPEAPEFAGFGSMMGMVGIFSLAMYLPYPILMIVFFRKPPVVEAMVN